MKNKIVAIIQARMGSTRLPGKVMKTLSGKPVLWHVINRLKYSTKVDEIVVATTSLKQDDVIEDFCKENNLKCFRGSSENVLSRYFKAAQKFNANIIVRITSDCPLIDPIIVDKAIEKFQIENSKGKVDYLSNVIKRTFPKGLDTEIFSFEALKNANNNAKNDEEKEHVTYFFYSHPEEFKLKNIENEIDYSNYRLTLDTKEDYELIKKIYNKLYQKDKIFYLPEIVSFLKNNPVL